MGRDNLVFRNTLSGYDRYNPRLGSPHSVAGLPMSSHADCRLLESMIVERMKTATGDDLDRLRWWHYGVVSTRREADRDRWPGWDIQA